MKFIKYLAAIWLTLSFVACGGGGGNPGLPTGVVTPLLTTAPASLTVAVGAVQEYRISGGKAPYQVSSSNVQISAASISNTSLLISGIADGSANIVISDAAGQTTTVAVIVENLFALYTTAPSSFTIAKGTLRVFSVGGGVPGYIAESSDTRIVAVTLSGSALSIRGVAAGSASIQIRDNANSMVTLSVTVGGDSPLGLYTSAPATLTVAKGSQSTYSVGGGVAGYAVASSDPRIATVSLNGNSMVVFAADFGSTTITIRDSAGSTLSVALTVASSSPGQFFTSAPSALFMGAGSSVSYVVSGGAQPYYFSSSDARVVTGGISGTSLTISALMAGSAVLQIADATGAKLQIVVTVDGATGGTGGPAAIEILPSSNSLPSAAGNKVTFVVTVKDAVNNAIPNQVVIFTSSSGILTGANPAPKTDANGTITTVSLSPGSDQSNRTITVTATAGAISKSINIPVVGTTVSISGPGSTLIGAPLPVEYTAKAVDSGGNPIAGASLTVTSATGNTLTPSALTTNLSGTASFNLTPIVPGTDTLTLTGLGTLDVRSVAVSNEDFSFTAPLAESKLKVNESWPVTVKYRVGGVGVAGQTVTFSTTRGTLTSTNATTNANGEASTSVSSTTAGPVTLSAQLGTARSSVTAVFIATVPSSIVLQANPNALPPNTGGVSTNQSTLSATVRDATGNPVSDQVVNFTAIADGSNGSISPGSGTTDANGMTSVQFIPGALSTAANGVKLRATVQSAPTIFADTTLTVNGDALFISIGIGSTLTVLDAATYEKDFSVYVTDANGVAAAGRSVTISVYPPTYKKGFLVYGGVWNYSGTPTTCANEDVNRSGILDGGEDINGNGVLDPGLPVVLFPASLTTDASGTATFKMRYGKNYALWLTTQITARALVGGTESSKTATYDLEMTFGDATAAASPANVISPFGTTEVLPRTNPPTYNGLCSNPN